MHYRVALISCRLGPQTKSHDCPYEQNADKIQTRQSYTPVSLSFTLNESNIIIQCTSFDNLHISSKIVYVSKENMPRQAKGNQTWSDTCDQHYFNVLVTMYNFYQISSNVQDYILMHYYFYHYLRTGPTCTHDIMSSRWWVVNVSIQYTNQKNICLCIVDFNYN